MSQGTETDKKKAYEKAISQPIAKFDVNPLIVDRNNQIVLAKRISTVQYGGKWHMPGGKVFVGERMSPASFTFAWVVRYLYIGHWSSPLTDTLAIKSNVTFLPAQNFLMSALLPGSWFPKLLAGNARMRRPLSLYFL